MAGATPIILVRQNREDSSLQWRQYFVITDNRSVVVHMEPALFGGWKFTGKVDTYGDHDWIGYARDTIVDFMMRNNDGLTKVAPDLGAFRDTLLAKSEAM